MNKLQLVKYILNHSDELFNWYCKEAFDLPIPDELTMNDVNTYGSGFYGYLADQLIDDARRDPILMSYIDQYEESI